MLGRVKGVRAVVKDHVAARFGDRDRTAHKGAFLCGALGSHDHGAGLTEVVGLASHVTDIGFVHMTAEDDLRLDLLTEQTRPFGVGLLLYIEGRFIDLCKGDV